MKSGKTAGILATALVVFGIAGVAIVDAAAQAKTREKTETFDRDPGWEGMNNRTAVTSPPVMVRQDFGYSKTNHAGGAKPGELGGFIQPAGETAYYAKVIPTATFDDVLSASGTFTSMPGEYHILIGFFNADAVNEWRTPNSIVLRLNGRGAYFHAFPEYLTSKWRINNLDGGHGFRSVAVPKSGEKDAEGFASGASAVHTWSLKYDPRGGEGGKPLLTATIDDQTSVELPDPAYLADGATFNRFGIMTCLKSADTGGEVYFDDITINGETETFDNDPNWEGVNNRNTYPARIVRTRFDYGFSPTNFAGGKSKGELGGLMFRGDCRFPEKMSCYGDAVGPLTLDKPLRASGKIAFTRGVTDSTTLFGFYNSADSMRSNPSQNDAIPESVLGVHVEGPSSEGFLFYPVWRAKGGSGQYGRAPGSNPYIYPDGTAHDWALEYNPDGADGNGQITITFDGEAHTFDLADGIRESGTSFDRFGIVTSWIDGNSQDVYLDDLTYTAAQQD